MLRAPLLLAALALAAAAPLASAQEPEDAYASYHRALVGENLEGMLQNSPEAQRAQMAGLTPAQKTSWLKMMSGLMPRSYQLRSKRINPGGQGASLYLTGAGKALIGGKPETLYGVAQMIVERSQWKVASVEWSNQDPGLPGQAEQAAPAPRGPYAPGAPISAPQKPAAAPAPAAAAPATPAAAQRPAPAPSPAAAQKAARSTPVVGSLDSAPERKLGTQKPPCVYKPVMTAEDLENCR